MVFDLLINLLLVINQPLRTFSNKKIPVACQKTQRIKTVCSTALPTYLTCYNNHLQVLYTLHHDEMEGSLCQKVGTQLECVKCKRQYHRL